MLPASYPMILVTASQLPAFSRLLSATFQPISHHQHSPSSPSPPNPPPSILNHQSAQPSSIFSLSSGASRLLSGSKTKLGLLVYVNPISCRLGCSSIRVSEVRSAMMVDTATVGRVINSTLKKEDDRGYSSGGWKSEDGRIKSGFASFRGKRASMEDCYDVKLSNIDGRNVCLFGIFDGHGGSRASEYLKEHLFDNLLKHPKFMANTKLALSETFNQTDTGFLNAERETFRDDGSTASTAIMVGNHLYVANVGDSRTVMSKSGKAIALSEDHKPNRCDERRRIEKAGGVVMWAGTWRVGGVLAMSRAFGNRMLKQYVVADPDIQDLEISEDTELLVLASDGLWDVVPNEDAVSIALTEEEPEAAARKLTETAFTRGSADNITCIVVRFHHNKPDPSGQLPSLAPSEKQSASDEVSPYPQAITSRITSPDPKAAPATGSSQSDVAHESNPTSPPSPPASSPEQEETNPHPNSPMETAGP